MADNDTRFFPSHPITPSEKGYFSDINELLVGSSPQSVVCQMPPGVGRMGKPSVRGATLLLQLQKKEGASFNDLKNNEYAGKNRSVFHTDILTEMHYYADIRKAEDGRYRYLGQLQSCDLPDKHVAIAMFENLRARNTSLFEISFELYTQGYRKYSPDFLRWLEIALIVIDVHPYGRQASTKDPHFVAKIKSCWDKVQGMCDKDFDAYLQAPSEASHVEIAGVKCARRILYRLRDLKSQGDLEQLERMKKDMRSKAVQDDKKTAQSGGRTLKVSRQQQVLDILQKNTNKEVLLENIWKEMHISSKKGADVALVALLALALGKQPIIYDKDAGTVKLLSQERPIMPPEEGTNLLTMVYDVIIRYAHNITREEVAYYAYRGGYWLEFKRGGAGRFYTLLNQYKEFLAIQGYIHYKVCPKNRHPVIWYQSQMWRNRFLGRDVAPYEHDFLHDFAESTDVSNAYGLTESVDMVSTYQMGTVADMSAIYGVDAADEIPEVCDDEEKIAKLTQDTERFLESEEYAVFCHYIARKKHACVLEKCLKEGPIPLPSYWSVCEGCDIKTWQDLWDAAGVLTRKKEGGRLMYNLQLSEFFWDYTGSVPNPEKNEMVAAVFALKYDKPAMPDHVIAHMLKQQGFRNVSSGSVLEILQGLDVFGLCSVQGNMEDHARSTVNHARRFVDLLLKPDANPACVLGSSGCMTQSYVLAQRVVEWVHNGAATRLWEVYQEKNISVTLQEKTADEEGGEPSRKRLRLQEDLLRPERIVQLEMPSLYAMLQQKNLRELLLGRTS